MWFFFAKAMTSSADLAFRNLASDMAWIGVGLDFLGKRDALSDTAAPGVQTPFCPVPVSKFRRVICLPPHVGCYKKKRRPA
jgi:hypothetical protein